MLIKTTFLIKTYFLSSKVGFQPSLLPIYVFPINRRKRQWLLQKPVIFLQLHFAFTYDKVYRKMKTDESFILSNFHHCIFKELYVGHQLSANFLWRPFRAVTDCYS